jgi:hypothetical protein
MNIGKTVRPASWIFCLEALSHGLLRATVATLGCEHFAAPSNTQRWRSRN